MEPNIRTQTLTRHEKNRIYSCKLRNEYVGLYLPENENRSTRKRKQHIEKCANKTVSDKCYVLGKALSLQMHKRVYSE